MSANKWMTPKMLAGLPGLPGTTRGISKMAERGRINRRQKRKGKGWEYEVASLPVETKTHIAKMQLTSSCEIQSAATRAVTEKSEQNKTKERAMMEWAGLADGAKKQRALSREWVVLSGLQFVAHAQLNKTAGVIAYCDALKTAEIAVPEQFSSYLPRRNGCLNVDKTTFNRWESAYKKLGRMGLVAKYGNRSHAGVIDTNEELQKIVLGAMLNNPHITGHKINDYLAAAHQHLPAVSSRTIDRWIQRWKAENAQVWTYMTNPDQWKNVYMPAFGSQHESIERLNQLWELDSTPGDWMLTDGRHSVIGCIDLYSRRVKLLVSKTSSAAAVCEVTRRAILDWGVPESVRTDNGKDYVSDRFVGAMRDLEIAIELCIAFASEQKATIERFFRTMSHGILDLLPGFIGHNVGERKVIEARKSFAKRLMEKDAIIDVELSSDELQKALDQWVDHIYYHNQHTGEGMNGKTPFQKFSEYRSPVRRIHNERALDVLLTPISGTRVVSKKGISFNHHHYIAAELVVGASIQLRRDEHDLGKLYVYDINGQFICVAECLQLLGISPAEAAAAAKSKTRKFIQQQKDELKNAKKAVHQNITQTVIDHRIEQSANVSAMPQPSESYSTQALEVAAHVASIQDGNHSVSDATVDIPAQEIASVLEIEDPRKLHAYWLRVQKRLEAGEQVSSEERDGCAIYHASEEYRSQNDLFEAFGLAAEDFV